MPGGVNRSVPGRACGRWLADSVEQSLEICGVRWSARVHRVILKRPPVGLAELDEPGAWLEIVVGDTEVPGGIALGYLKLGCGRFQAFDPVPVPSDDERLDGEEQRFQPGLAGTTKFGDDRIGGGCGCQR